MIQRKVAGVASSHESETAKCASCGGAFDCGASSESCWCGEIRLSEAARARLRERFSGCLCRACLERFAAAAGNIASAEA